MKIKYIYILSLLLAAGISGCDKSDEKSAPSIDRTTLNYVVRNNFGLTYLATALNRTGLEKDLTTPGPYTLLAPSDAAFQAAGFSNPAAVFAAPTGPLGERSRYHILKTELKLSTSPLGLNQPHESSLGSMLFLSRAIKGVDTITTINGARVTRLDTKASNGLMQVIDRFLAPNLYTNVKDALAGDVELSLFYHALKQAGLLDDLVATENYTIFAVNNAAMQTAGYSTIETIQAAAPATLRSVFAYHIAKNRKFAQDYFLLAAAGQTTYAETMLDGRTLTVNLLNQSGVPNSFTGITLRGIANVSPLTPTRSDGLAGNGVIHVMGGVMR